MTAKTAKERLLWIVWYDRARGCHYSHTGARLVAGQQTGLTGN